jgi:hypothetical protein
MRLEWLLCVAIFIIASLLLGGLIVPHSRPEHKLSCDLAAVFKIGVAFGNERAASRGGGKAEGGAHATVHGSHVVNGRRLFAVRVRAADRCGKEK